MAAPSSSSYRAGGSAPAAGGNAANALLATRIRINELFVEWLSSEEGAGKVDVLVSEYVAAARQPPVLDSFADGTSQPRSSSTPSTEASPSHYDPHTPVTPPHNPRPARPGPEPATSPQRYIDRVDELDMRSTLGAASPVSPNQAVRAVDPQLPRSPDVSMRAGAARRLAELDTPSTASGSSGGAHATGATATAAGALASAAAASHSASNSRAASPVTNRTVTRTATFDDIPRFFRVKKGHAATGRIDGADAEIAALDSIFSSATSSSRAAPNARARVSHGSVDMSKAIKRAQFDTVCTEVFRLPAWMRNEVFKRLVKASGLPESTTTVRYRDVRNYYDNVLAHATPNRRLFELIRSENSRAEHLTVDELSHTVWQLVTLHPGLEFLTQPEFQQLYCVTVATRIVYHHERRQSRTVAWSDFDHSDVPGLMRSLDSTADINTVLRYFSYEHFYVLYCRFWELDRDKTHSVGLDALTRYNDVAISRKALERVVQGKGHRLARPGSQELDFEDFIFFCLSEEDKNSLPAKRYWFNVLDVDEDGIISGYEMEYFFGEYSHAEQFAEEDMRFEDVLCQMLDMFVPNLPHREGVTFDDIRNCETAEHFFNMLVNAPKFKLFEHRDPFSESQQRHAYEKTAWDRFARAEYDRMAQEAAQ